ncbi:MAG: single-stranded-DNA-specific exonuclease RecJ, partial [Flavobacteriaceae bacterium]|nr:single-stranded-DNA-specific exonuclease RecJ [Flavobacteriaceae bacterium]
MRWTLKQKPDVAKVRNLVKALNVDAIIAELLVQRGIENFEEAKSFFRPSLGHLHDPYLMSDMDKAVTRVEKAIQNGENILVFGDYDVDGTTSVALVSSYLKTRTYNVATYIPDRYEEGYGISTQGIDYAHDNDISLIIALDCGIKAVDKVEYAKEKGIDFIICDHHRPGKELPNAIAVLDPKREDCNYPYKELCGCGVGFKLVQALALNEGLGIEDLTEYLDLVATAIGADIVPITGENRVLAYFGLQVINSNPRPGFRAILEQVKKKELTVTDVVFIIAPRINAAGRMKHGNHAVTLLTETDYNLAAQYALDINQFNLERKDADQRITEEALLKIAEYKEESRFTSVVYDEHWHKGVIGIVASRLTETYYRPTLVFTKSGDRLAASARSVSGFDVYNAIEACSEHLEQFGGH